MRFRPSLLTIKPVATQGLFLVAAALLSVFAGIMANEAAYAEHIHTTPQDVYDKMRGSNEDARNEIVSMEDACYDRLQNASGSTARQKINNSIPYDHREWVSPAGDPSSTTVQAGANQEVELQINSLAFYCAIVVENSHLEPGTNIDRSARVTDTNFPRDRHPITDMSGDNNNNEASYSARYTKIKEIIKTQGSGEVTKSAEEDVYGTGREGTRYSFIFPPEFTYDTGNVSSNETVELQVDVKRIIEFHGNEYVCQSPEGTRVSGPDDFGPCDSRGVTFRFQVIVEENDDDSQQIEGRKIAEDGLSSGDISDNTVYIDGGNNGQTTASPFSIEVSPGEHWVSAERTGYEVEYTYCVNTKTCHDSASRQDGSVLQVDVPEGGFVDVRFYFSQEPQEENAGAIRGEKVDEQHNASSRDPWYDNLARVRGEGTNRSDSGNPFRFENLQEGSYRVSVAEEQGYSVRWIYCRSRDDTINEVQDDGSCEQNGTRPQSGEGSSFNVQVRKNQWIDVRFVFEQQVRKGRERVYGANYINIRQDYLRDNKEFDIDIRTYLWPNAGLRSRISGNTDRFWLAGIWGEDFSDVVSREGSRRTDPNAMRRFNTRAERSCPDNSNCLQRVPMAYVPADDGSGENNTRTEDGSRTPNGNNWRQIREESFGSNSRARVRSCRGNYTTRYNRRCGGIASNVNLRRGGARGNHIKNVEVSNIRVRGYNPDALMEKDAFYLQGRVDGDVLQPYEDRNWNLPRGSQGPASSGPAWDNIRSPETGLLQGNITRNRFLFSNPGNSSPQNFTDDPENSIGRSEYTSRSQKYGEVSAVTLLQDGQAQNNQPYEKKNEPITYSATLNKLDRVDLVWDEYVDWSQVDDKGHWYTRKAERATGIDRGEPDDDDVARLQDPDRGTPRENDHYHCRWHRADHDGDGDREWHCHKRWHDEHCDWRRYRDDVGYRRNNKRYYQDSTRTRYGWLNTQTRKRRMPYGKNDQTARSAFWRDYSNQPPWSWSGVTNFWQDGGVTTMDNSGSTNKPFHSSRWIYDTSDPAYSNRHLYIHREWPRFKTSWYYRYRSTCMYDNGSFDNYREDVDTHYHNAEKVYEDTEDWEIDGHVYGKYGNEATFDGKSDGEVDIGWRWSSNYRRVRYEQTYDKHHRKLGRRDKDASGKYRLYGLTEDKAIQGGRDMATIWNPTISASEGDIFSGGNLHSYFQSSQANSAFLFSNNKINKFNTSSNQEFPDYTIHDLRDRVDAYYPNNRDPASYVFRDLNELEGKAESIRQRPCNGNNSSGYSIRGRTSLERNDPDTIRDNVLRSPGDARIGRTTFTDTAGTIIVEGDLCIDGNITYGNAGNDREGVPSVGFIVKGHIVVDPDVTVLNGSFFSNREIYTGSYLLNVDRGGINKNNKRVQWTANNDRTASDNPLQVNGLMIANSYNLARQPSGRTNRNTSSEEFNYDGRVVINPPPGFSRIFTADAVWNDTVPRN